MKWLAFGLLLFVAACTTGCTTNSLATIDHLEANLKARGCGSGANLTITPATVTSLPSVSGNYHFDCPQTKTPEQ